MSILSKPAAVNSSHGIQKVPSSSSFGRSTTKLDAGGGAAGAFAHTDADAGRFDRPSTAPPTQELARPQFGRGSAAAAEAVTEVRGGQGAAEVFSGQHFGDDRFARNDTVGAAAASAQFERPQFARKATKFHDDGNAYDVFGRSLGVDTNADGVENTFDPSENVQVNMGEGAEEPPAPEEPREPTEPRFTRLGVDTTADGEENTYDPSENVHVHMGSGSDEPPAPEEAPEPTQPRFTRKGVDTNADGQANTYVHSPPPNISLEHCQLADQELSCGVQVRPERERGGALRPVCDGPRGCPGEPRRADPALGAGGGGARRRRCGHGCQRGDGDGHGGQGEDGRAHLALVSDPARAATVCERAGRRAVPRRRKRAGLCKCIGEWARSLPHPRALLPAARAQSPLPHSSSALFVNVTCCALKL